MEQKIKVVRDKTLEVLKTYFTEDAQAIIVEVAELKKNPEIMANNLWSEELNIYGSLAKFVAFAVLPESDQLELFRTFLVKALRVGIDIKNRFSIKMNLTSDAIWPETVQTFLEKMLQNEERIGREFILVEGERGSVPPTLANWLRDYNRKYGMDRHEKIVPHRYLNENTNAQKLGQEDRVLLLRVLEFYEGLKFPSQSQIENAMENALNQYDKDQENDLLEDLTTEKTVKDDIVQGFQEEINRDLHEIIDEDVNTLLKRFPRLIDQNISQKPIKLLFNGEISKPTVGNWLADYRAYVGIGSHEINERSDYLLRSANVQNLSVEERERLGLILRSYDEGYLLPFSIAKQEIIFEKVNSLN